MAPDATAFAGGDTVPLAAYKAANPTGVPAALAQASLAERGAYLVRAADCAPCHSPPGRPDFSGGRAFHLPSGTVYSANITPDPAHGIGAWSDAEFVRAVKHGVRRDGQRLYPAMPYTSFAGMTDADALAIRAYLKTIPAVAAPEPANTLGFPYNQRALMGPWSWAFAKSGEFRPNPARSPEWNRGAYLTEAMGHCGECHTPRGVGYQVDNRRKFAGALTGGWMAHNLTGHRDAGVGGWSDAALRTYLSNRFRRGSRRSRRADGRSGRSRPAPPDRRGYRRDDHLSAHRAPAVATDAPRRKLAPAAELYAGKAGAGAPGEALFGANCAGCHDWTGVSPHSPYARLTGLRSVNDPSAANIVQSVLWGIDRRPPTACSPCPPSAPS
jgi:mono/diheme cytochrome c family protein